jgi:hypothetical protein
MNLKMTRKEAMYALLAEQESSGMSQLAFCKLKQLNLGTFQYWRAKRRRESEAEPAPGMRFVPLRVQEPQHSEALEVVFPNGVKVTGLGTDLSSVIRLVKLWQ